VELGRVVERAVRDSHALDVEALCVIHGERVWAIQVNVTVLDHDGNLTDAAVLAAMAALSHFRRPEVTVVQEGDECTRVVVHHSDERPTAPLPLHHVPLAVTFALLPGAQSVVALLDPTAAEEGCMAGSVTYSANAHRELCALHKLGGSPLAATTLVSLARTAATRAAELHVWLVRELKSADKKAEVERAVRIRGRAFRTGHNPIGDAFSEVAAKPIPEDARGLDNLGYDQLHLTYRTKDDEGVRLPDSSGALWAAVVEAAAPAASPNFKRKKLSTTEVTDDDEEAPVELGSEF
jgi:ribonuclease PH